MARITVEDCLENIPNRFELVLGAARRAKQLLKGARPLVESDNKEVVTAVREIAARNGKIGEPDARPARAGPSGTDNRKLLAADGLSIDVRHHLPAAVMKLERSCGAQTGQTDSSQANRQARQQGERRGSSRARGGRAGRG